MWPQQYPTETSTMNNYSTSSEFISSPSSISNSSPFSCMMSPEQTVPQFEKNIFCTQQNQNMHDTRPHLMVVEQPVDQFRFRYKSEMSGTHGCLSGRTSKKSFPTVKLENYSGEAVVACTLVQVDEAHDPHPHRLVIWKNTEEIDDPHIMKINRKNGFSAMFRGMSILYTSKKMIVEELMRKHKSNYGHMKINDRDLRMEYDNVAKNINMNSVCLKFSVYNLENRELCPPVYSEPIDNTKCAETCQLKIVNMSKMSGSSQGEDLILLFVEKVNKKNIKVRFFEMQKGVRVWEAFGSFSELDVHHQYGIAFKTPPYKDVYSKHDVNVFLELYRPKDHAVSPKMPFCYKASLRHYKRRRTDEDYAVETNMSRNDMLASLPVTVEDINKVDNNQVESVAAVSAQPLETFNYFPSMDMLQTPFDSRFPLNEDAYFDDLNNFDLGHIDPLELTSIINDLVPEENTNVFGNTLLMGNCLQTDTVAPIINKNRSSGKSNEKWPKNQIKPFSAFEERYCNKSRSIFNQFLTVIKQGRTLLPEDINMICKLAEKNLSRNDNLIHLFVWMNYEKFLSKMLDILNANYSHKLREILDKINLDGLAPLHIATEYSYSGSVKLLLKGGCNPDIQVKEDGCTSYHIAVKNDDEECLKCLLHYNKLNLNYGFDADCNVANYNGFTALHLAVTKGSLPLLIRLIGRKDSLNMKTTDGKNILHLAVEYGHVVIVRYLLMNYKMDPNAVTYKGHTSLHLACVLENKQAEEIVSVLLENKADPLQLDRMKCSPWMLVVNNANNKIIEIMKEYVPQEMASSEIDDEMSSLEESLSSTSIESDKEVMNTFDDKEFMNPKTSTLIAKSLDATGKWREVVRVMKMEAIMPICGMVQSPSTIVLNNIEMEEKYSILDLYNVLVKIKAHESTNILRNRYSYLK